MDDFDNDGLLDLVVTSLRPHASRMAFYRNKGDGDLRGPHRGGRRDRPARRPGLRPDRLQQRRPHGRLHPARGLAAPPDPAQRCCATTATARFTDVTQEAGLLDPVNSNAAAWADYDNDGWLDLFVCCEQQPNRLYHNRGDGTFEEVAAKAGVQGETSDSSARGAPGSTSTTTAIPTCSSTTWAGRPSCTTTTATAPSPNVTAPMGIDGPHQRLLVLGLGLRQRRLARHLRHVATTARSRTWSRACWASRTAGIPTGSSATPGGKGFEDVTREAGLDMVFATMGSNFGDFDNDGFLDMYLGTGDPSFATLVPNRMFKNVAGQRFAEITGVLRARATCRRATASPAATGTATATSTSSSRWAAPSTATSITTSCSRTPARGTTG